MWCDQAKSVWSRSNSVFIFLTNCMHHFYSYIFQKTPLKLVIWFQRYEQLKDAKNNRKQKTFSALFGSILKSIFPTSDWFCLITSHIFDGSLLLFKKINFRQTMAISMQPGHTHNLKQAQDPGSYVRLILSRISLASKPRTPGKRGTLAWIADTILLCKVLFCFVWNLFLSIIELLCGYCK